MRTRTLVALLTSVIGGLAVVGGGAFGARAGIRGQRAASQRVVDMLPVHADWWRERLQHEGQLTYLAIGDSAAQGVGATAPGRGYVGLLARRIRHRSRMSVRVVNLSVSGSTTWGAKQDQLPKLRNYTPDVCTVSIGANDIADFHPDKFERNIRAIYGAVPSHAIVAELPCMFVPDRERKVAVANEIVHRVAGEFGLTVAPLHVITKRVGLRRTFFNSYGDLFHPNDRGYEIWASAFEPAVDARVDTVAAIRHYLSAREAEDLGSEAGAVASARAEQDNEHAEELEHGERPGRVERLRQRMTGAIPLPVRSGEHEREHDHNDDDDDNDNDEREHDQPHANKHLQAQGAPAPDTDESGTGHDRPHAPAHRAEPDGQHGGVGGAA
jgi:lysophospholipase L1-like esterase